MIVQLKENRIKQGLDNHGNPHTGIFLPKGAYEVDRVIKGLGYLVFIKKHPKVRTIIRFGDGIEGANILDEVYK